MTDTPCGMQLVRKVVGPKRPNSSADYDPNDLNKSQIFAQIIGRLAEDNRLSEDLPEIKGPKEIVEKLLSGENGKKYSKSRVMDLIEFGRIIHAELSAIYDAARCGTAIRGRNTVFHCISVSSLRKAYCRERNQKVEYLELYPKSYAWQFT